MLRNRSAAPDCIWGSMNRVSEYITSSAVTSRPSWNLMLRRSVNVQVSPPREAFQKWARQLLGTASAGPAGTSLDSAVVVVTYASTAKTGASSMAIPGTPPQRPTSSRLPAGRLDPKTAGRTFSEFRWRPRIRVAAARFHSARGAYIEVKTGQSLVGPEPGARWATRRVDRQAAVLQRMHRRFGRIGGCRSRTSARPSPTGPSRPVAGRRGAGAGDPPREGPHSRGGRLHRARLPVLRRTDRVRPDPPRRTGAVRLLRRRRARHHCGEPLAFAAAAAGPSLESEGVMV
jgi:hypothetical protein